MKKILSFLVFPLLLQGVAFAQQSPLQGRLTQAREEGPTVEWRTETGKDADGRMEIRFIGVPAGNFDEVHGTLEWIHCVGNECHSPEQWDFSVRPSSDAAARTEPVVRSTAKDVIVEGGSVSSSAPLASKGGSIWTLLIEAILWGFAMLLTPCVFPMVPMTVSYFIKGSGNKSQGRFNATMYGLFIVLLYTVPISVIIALTRLFGGEAVTADIFNWLATHWLPNIIFFIVFMVFAASFFGAFEIRLPSSLVGKSDRNSDKKGLAGIFFMALTLVLVSFSCTGPIVGSVLIKSTAGEFWTPMVTMLAFSVAFALPFTVLALFPALLKNLPKSGGWLNSVKVVLGFIEIALGLKFLSVADQTYHWGILGRDVYLAIWIVCFVLLGLYLLGKIRFKYDSPSEYIPFGRMVLALCSFAFALWLLPGLWGAPLKALSGYLPPLESQDFVIGQARSDAEKLVSEAPADGATLKLPHGLWAYDSIEEGLRAAKAGGKRVFVDITGYGCVNCREMESRVWSDPEVLESLRNDFVIVALYTDDKAELPSSRWITTAEGKLLKGTGRVNSYIARTRFGVNSQPNYLVLDSDGTVLKGPRGYNLSVPSFLEFLQ